MNRENLKKLATYLYQLPNDYEYFDMGMYCAAPRSRMTISLSTYLRKGTSCGTVGCAVGHGPNAGIMPDAGDCDLFMESSLHDWTHYCDHYFLDSSSPEYDWCFAGEWSDADNTPRGAAQRILWMLENGVPNDFDIEGIREVDDEESNAEFYIDLYREVTL